MKLQFKQQDFQINAVKAVVDCFDGQPIKTNRFTLERSKDLIRKAKTASLRGKNHGIRIRYYGRLLDIETLQFS